MSNIQKVDRLAAIYIKISEQHNEIEGLKADKDSWRKVAWTLELEKLSLREQLDAWAEKYSDLKIKSDANQWAHDNMQEQLASANAETIRVIYSNCYDGSGDSNKRLLEYVNQLEGKG